MANESKYYKASEQTLEANGASIASAAFAQANDASLDMATSNYPLCDFVLTVAYTTAPVAGEVINLYARPMNISGTNDSQVPSANYLGVYMGSFLLENLGSSTTQYILLADVPVPFGTCDLYLENKVVTQSVNAGWTLKGTPKSFGPT